MNSNNGKACHADSRQGGNDQIERFNHRCNLIRDRVRSVARRFQNGLYLVGRPGTGKTFVVQEALHQLGASYRLRNCHATALGLWAELRKDPRGLVVLDDLAVLLRQAQALQVLLAAMGGEPGESRLVTYVTHDRQEEVQFRGGVIAISNVPLGRDPLAHALASRVLLLEHEPTDEELVAQIRLMAHRGAKGLTCRECREVAEFVIEESHQNGYRPDLRSLGKALQDRRQDKAGETRCSWQDLVRSSMRQQHFDTVPRVRTKQDELVDQREQVRRVVQQFPHDRRRQQQESRLPRSTFYKRLREVTLEDKRNPRASAAGSRAATPKARV
jgi:hypothetical protein